MKRATSHQVAKLANVSRTTVSFVLNDVPDMGISPETRSRVLEAARQLGYVPNALARSLVSGATRTVGLLMPQDDQVHANVDAYIPRFLSGVTLTCQSRGYKVLFEPLNRAEPAGTFVGLVDSGRIDGLIALNPRKEDLSYLNDAAANGFPLVVFGPSFTGYDSIRSLNADNRDAARRATEHLLALGHRRIAHIGFAADDTPIVRERLSGFRDAMQAASVDVDPAWIGYGNYSAGSGEEAMRAILARRPGITALFAGNDTVAFGAMAALRDVGLRIPDDVAIVGYDDIPLAAYAAPPLTTMRTEPFDEGSHAAAMLLRIIAGEQPERGHTQAEVPLVVRRSCGARTG
ncbi:LacI family DNA-binding transcriptional regulator [Paraburkholderia susongensis]|uniref:Transcriptional regulator, LacI family n=1 Tax=Paraburkholderia susongensis TaxID=1515439 RepID=A0A1X7LIV3_9BURK|nr:LacI family DNA-binding transcriptional regulator [Paraburkholderia susongensis]SMG53715.1 transcriptional regulator, LacI family [Paraburkholderia susongensis]